MIPNIKNVVHGEKNILKIYQGENQVYSSFYVTFVRLLCISFDGRLIATPVIGIAGISTNGGISYVFPCKYGSTYKIKVLEDTSISPSYNRFRIATSIENPIDRNAGDRIYVLDLIENDPSQTEATFKINNPKARYVTVTVAYTDDTDDIMKITRATEIIEVK